MKNLYFLLPFLLLVNIVFAGGTAPRNAEELWLVIVPIVIILVMLLSTYLNKTIRQKIEERRLRKAEEALELNNEHVLDHEFVAI